MLIRHFDHCSLRTDKDLKCCGGSPVLVEARLVPRQGQAPRRTNRAEKTMAMTRYPPDDLLLAGR